MARPIRSRNTSVWPGERDFTQDEGVGYYFLRLKRRPRFSPFLVPDLPSAAFDWVPEDTVAVAWTGRREFDAWGASPEPDASLSRVMTSFKSSGTLST